MRTARSFKGLAFDIDGTITNEAGAIDLEAVRALRELEGKGIRTFLITGRNFCVTKAMAKYLGTCGLCAAENGGILWNGREKIYMGSRRKAEAGLETLRKEMGDRKIEVVNSPYREVDILIKRTVSLSEANEILLRSGVGAHVLDSGAAYHVVDVSVNKGEALKKLAEIAGLSAKDVVAIGDNMNDIDMLREAGYGIAVGNAPKALKDQADYVCKAGYAEGFKEGIPRIFKV